MEIQFIVDKLNEKPFSLDLSLVIFDEKSPFELLQLLNQIFAHLSPEHEVDLRDEPPETTADRMIEFARVLNYKHDMTPEDFRQGLMSGDREVIYALMNWCLQSLDDLKKRAYLSKYLVNIEVPEEFFADEVVVDTYQQYKALQQQFIETHKQATAIAGQSMQPGELRKEISQFEMEKEQLNTKIARLKTKLSKQEDFKEFFDVVSKLRREQEEEGRLAERMIEQEQQLRQSEQRLQQISKRLRDTQAASRDESANALLQRLEEDTDVTRALCEDKLPQDIAQKQTRVHHIQLVIDSPAVSDQKLAEIQREISSLQNDLGRLTEQAAKMENPGDDKLAMFKQQASMVAKRKQDLLDKLQMLNEEKVELETELQDKQDAAAAKTGTKVLKGAEFKKFADQLRGKQMQYKTKKAQLNEIKAEFGILRRTEEILKSRAPNLPAFLEKYEAAKKAGGYQTTQEKLESVSGQSAALNQDKVKSLDEISRLASEIIAQIKDKKGKLAPQIKELRAVRVQYNELEADWMEKKQVYETTNVGLEAERSKLEQQLTAYIDELQREESRFHYINALSTMLDTQQRRLDNEGRAKLSDGVGEFRSYRELYQNKIQQQENLSKTLREKQKMSKEGHEGNLEQVAAFRSLRKLMAAKVQSAKAQQFEFAAPQSQVTASGADMFVVDE